MRLPLAQEFGGQVRAAHDLRLGDLKAECRELLAVPAWKALFSVQLAPGKRQRLWRKAGMQQATTNSRMLRRRLT